eukprot:m.215439 g.215439  ORF g.215439 m.215439 type:complete len:1764 (-) comp16975_c0_seq3:279-5570(-)
MPNCFLSITSSAAKDMAGNDIEPRPSSTALPVSALLVDSTAPICFAYALDMDVGLLTLNFSEVINVSSINLNQIQLGSSHLVRGEILSLTARSIRIVMPTRLMYELQRDPLTAVDGQTSALTLFTSAFQDMQGVANEEQILLPTLFTPDSTPPLVRAFAFNMSFHQIHLTFSEPVNVTTFAPSAIQIHNNRSSTRVALTGGRFLSDAYLQTVVFWQINPQDSIYIAQLEDIASGPNNTFATFNPGLVVDMQGIPYNTVQTLQVTDYTSDIVPPEIMAFSLNMTSGTLVLNFSEVVDHTSFQPDGITLVNQATNYTLTGVRLVSQQDDTILEVGITTQDLNNIKYLTSLCVSKMTANLAVAAGTILDQAGNPNIKVRGNHPIPVSVFVGDLRRPSLVSFDLDMDNETLSITFDETINVNSIRPAFLAIQAQSSVVVQANTTNQDVLTLSAASTVHATADITSVRIHLTKADANELRRRPGLATSAGTTFLAIFSAQAAQDMAGNAVIEAPHTSAIAVTSYIADNTAPRLVRFDLNMDMGLLALSFDEPVRATSVDLTNIVVQASKSIMDTLNTSVAYRLQGGLVSTDNSTEIEVQLTVDDINGLKYQPALATSQTSTYLSIGQGLVVDMAGLAVVAVPSGDGMQVTQYVADMQAPAIVNVAVNMTAETLTLMFDEPIDVATLVIAHKFSIKSPSNSSSSATHVLQAGSTTALGPQMTVVIDLAQDDVFAIKVDPLLLAVPYTGPTVGPGVSVGQIAVLGSAVSDMAGNAILQATHEVTARNFYADEVRPRVLSVLIDTNSSRVFLNFDEPVDVSTLDAQQLTALAAQGAWPPTNADDSYTLQGASTQSNDGTQLVLELLIGDTHSIKLLESVWVDLSSAWLRAGPQFVVDMAGNMLVPAVVQATTFIGDEIRPQVVAAALDMNAGRLQLNFSEPVNVSSVRPEELILQRAAYVVNANIMSSMFVHQLSMTTSVLTVENGLSLELGIVRDDLDALKIKGIGASSAGTAWVTISDAFVMDMADQSVRALVNGVNALRVASLVNDTTAPVLTGFTLDMNNHTLVLEFSETVESMSLDVLEITLQARAVDLAQLQWYEWYTLSSTGGSSVISSDGPVQVVRIGVLDANALKTRHGLVRGQGTTFLSFSPSLVTDRAGNSVLGVMPASALQADAFTADTTAAALVSFSIDLSGQGAALVNLTFDEPIASPSVDVFELVLYAAGPDSSAVGVEAHRLGDNSMMLASLQINAMATPPAAMWSSLSNAVQANQTLVQVVLGRSDVDRIKVLATLCVNGMSCFIGFSSSFAADMAGNAVASVGISATMLADAIEVDRTAPELTGFDLDMNRGLLVLSFSEAMDASRLVPTGLTFASESGCGSSGTGGLNFTLSGGAVSNADSPILVMNMTEADMNELRALHPLARGPGTTYLGIRGDAAFDMQGNAVLELVGCGAVSVSQYEVDVTPPALVSFVLDMDHELLLLTFSETVNISSVDVSAAALLGISTIALAGSNVSQSDYTMVRLALPTSVVLDIQADYLLCVASDVSSCNLRLQSSFLRDNFGNALVPGSAAASAILADSTGPRVTGFVLDMSAATFSISFNEVVRLPSLDVTGINIVNGNGALVQLTSSTEVLSTGNDTVLTFALGLRDLSQLQLNPSLAISAATSYLAVQSHFVTDMTFNALIPGPPIRASLFAPDVVEPQLVASQLDMNFGVLSLNFSEVMNVSSFDVTNVGIQDNALAFRDVDTGERLAAMSLTGGTILCHDWSRVHL